MESAKASSEPVSPCWKKKATETGFLADVKDHLEQFVNTSIDQHRICLKKTIRGMGDYVKLKKRAKGIAESSSAAKST